MKAALGISNAVPQQRFPDPHVGIAEANAETDETKVTESQTLETALVITDAVPLQQWNPNPHVGIAEANAETGETEVTESQTLETTLVITNAVPLR